MNIDPILFAFPVDGHRAVFNGLPLDMSCNGQSHRMHVYFRRAETEVELLERMV